ncbi:MAG: AMP-dependent synthetase [Deltaproteobacteria bacterium]|nr:AMP-dependent synthetase [Deltaproteobacteria bacterium]
MNVMMLLEMGSQAMGERTGIQCGDDRWTIGELFAGAGRVASHFRGAGVEHAAILDVSSPAVPLALFGAGWAGLPFVPLNYRLTGDELDALIERITPALLVTDDQRAEQLRGRDGIQVVTREEFLGIARGTGEVPDPDWQMDPEEIAILLFTSGTTGVPKAAVLRHKHMVSYILGSVEFMGSDDADAVLVSVPPYHVAGMAALMSSLYAGRRIVQLPNFDAAEWLRLAEKEAITNAFVVPTMLSRIIDELEASGASSPSALRSLAYGGGKMPLPVIDRAMRQFTETDFTNAYGLTETSSTIAVLGPDDHRAAAAADSPEARKRLASAGRPLPSIEVEIRDEAGKALPPGQRGEIHVRGEQVSGEYVGRGSLLIEGGWFPTNDGGYLDEEGYLFIDGRIDDVIVRGGENLSPGEIEDVLHEHADVADCAVVGIPDEQWGEGVGAVIVRKSGSEVTAEDLQGWVKEHLRSSRAPQRLEFWDELPYNETGKLLRRKVKADLGES